MPVRQGLVGAAGGWKGLAEAETSCWSIPCCRAEIPGGHWCQGQGFPWMDAAAWTLTRGTIKGCIYGRVDTDPVGWVFWHVSPGRMGLCSLWLWGLFEAPTKATLLPTGLDFCWFHCSTGDRDGKTCRKGRIMFSLISKGLIITSSQSSGND